jgi:hypothetical protein
MELKQPVEFKHFSAGFTVTEYLMLFVAVRGAIPSLPHTSLWRGAWLNTGYVFVAWYLVQHRD